MRIRDPKAAAYKNYGARGLTMDDAWMASFPAFKAYLDEGIEVVPPYEGVTTATLPPPGYTLDRINNDLGYQPGNLRFASRTVNNLNRRAISNKTSPYRGVFWASHKNRWVAKVKLNGVIRWSATFIDEIEAAKARDEAAKLIHGEFAMLNFG